MLRRFYSPEIDRSSRSLELDRDQSLHASRVLRLNAGDLISVFDGRGSEFECRIERISKASAEIEIVRESEAPAPESPLRLTLAVGLLKHDKFDLVVQKAVELGVSRFVPLLTARTEIPTAAADKRVDRWKKIAIEATKQCGRAVVMEICRTKDLSDFLSSEESGGIFFVERGGDPMQGDRAKESLTAVVGPEGGWESAEIALARENGFELCSLGTRILRAETAAITAAALIQFEYGDMR